jgi:hypothetical protein
MTQYAVYAQYTIELETVVEADSLEAANALAINMPLQNWHDTAQQLYVTEINEVN